MSLSAQVTSEFNRLHRTHRGFTMENLEAF